MTLDYDLLVLGGGVAGTAAALSAAGRGRRVALVRPGPGLTGLVAGGWRGPLPAGLGAALEAEGLAHLPAPAPLPHGSGALYACDRAPAAHLAAAPAEGALVCGIAGLAGYHAPALARLWGAAAGVRLEAATLEAGPMPGGGWSPASLAGRLERDAAPLADALAAAVRERGARSAILPPVLGLANAGEVRRRLAEAAGVEVGEAVGGLPPSLPGWRLDRALLGALAAAGVEVVRGRALSAQSRAGRVVAVRALRAEGGEEVWLGARAVVLATGKYLAGGLVADEDGFREAVLGCPVRVEHLGATYGAPDPLALTRPERGAPQPLLAAGVSSDAAGRPLDERGGVLFENVRVAGTLRAGCEAASTGLGAAAADGWRAGALAAEAT